MFFVSRGSVDRNVRFIQSKEWEDWQTEKDMNELLRVRGVVLAVLEKARENKCVFLCLRPISWMLRNCL